MSNQNTSSSSVGLPSLLTVLFVGLKLAGVISWSWLWVLSPLWIPFVFAVLWMLFVVAVFGGSR